MGLFSSKRIVSVSSVVYNMAGPEEDRPNYLKSLVIRNVLSGTNASMGDTLNNGYLAGPGIKLRSFYRWADEHYDYIGMPEGEFQGTTSISNANIASYIVVGINQSAWVQYNEYDSADYKYWVEQYILDNNPSLIDTNWSASINLATKLVTIKHEDNTTETFTATSYDVNAKYLYIYYTLVSGEDNGPITLGNPIDIGSNPFPSTTGWTVVNDVANNINVELTTTTEVVDSSNSANNTTTTSNRIEVYTVKTTNYERTVYSGTEPTGNDAISGTKEIRIHYDNYEIYDVVTTNTVGSVTTTETKQMLRAKRSYQNNTQTIDFKEWSTLKLAIYPLGSGIAELDAAMTATEGYGKFFPTIPVRNHNKFIGTSHYPQVYEIAQKAYKKATGSKMDALFEKLEENENLGDIDHAYIVFGVSLNVVENSCKKYLYKFFQKLQQTQIGGPTSYNDWIQSETAYSTSYAQWLSWKEAQTSFFHPLFGTPEPTVINNRRSLPNNEMRFKNSGAANIEYDTRINWTFINESSVLVGQGKPGAKQGDLWIEYAGQDAVTRSVYLNYLNPDGDFSGWLAEALFDNKTVEKIRIYWQRSNETYSYMEVVGLIHRNYIYEGHSVTITAKEALEDADESGLIIPIHYATYREMSIKDSTQMATACVFLVLNAYEVRKQKWYQRGIFKILFVVVIAIVSAVFTGGAGIGLLGTHMAVGSALGFSGLTAAIVGSIANAMAALVLTTLIEYGAKALFGDAIGGIIASVIGFVAMNAISNFSMTGSLAINWGSLMNVQNLMKLTSAIGNGYADFIRGSTQELQNEFNTYMDDKSKEYDKIRRMFLDEFGNSIGVIDPMEFVRRTNSAKSDYTFGESRQTFLTRTLMTGTDIAEMSKSMLNDFPRLTLQLPTAFT